MNTHNNNDEQLKADILQALENDHELDFKIKSNCLREGKCPSCGHRELWTNRENPFVLFCGRLNNCGERFSVRDRYKDLFSNWTERHPATDEDPHATARAYLTHDRQLNGALTAGSYTQEYMKLANGSTAPCIRFRISDDCYWQRLMDKKAIARNKGKAAKIVGSYKGKGWQLPKQVIKENDWVWITEGIFKTIALNQQTFNKEPIKSITGLSANNLPLDIIKEHQGKNVTWVIALDNDNAGIVNARKYRKIIKDMGETCITAFPATKQRDWDDELRLDHLNDGYFKQSLWRGKYFMAETAKEKAFWLHIMEGSNYMLLEYDNRLWRSSLKDKKDTSAMAQFNEMYNTNKEPLYTEPKHDLSLAMNEFSSAFTTLSISNCLPKFLYAEINPQTDEKHYFFRISFPNRNHTLVGLSANDIDCPSNFKRSILSKATGARIKAVQADIDILHERWFDHSDGPNEIRTIPYIGYDKETGCYAFPDFGYCNGKMMEKNAEGYLQFSTVSIKSGLKQLENSVYHIGKTEFNPCWYQDFYYVFKNTALAALAFWAGTLFVEQIRTKQEGFTFLEISGDRETGKTTLTKFLWRLLGLKGYEGVDPNKMNEKALSRKYCQLSNLPFVLIEADHGNFDFDSLKTMWEGGIGRGTGLKNHGLETNEEPFKGSLMVVQNLTVDGQDALLSRFFRVPMKQTSYDPEAERAIHRLRDINIEDAATFRNAVLTNEQPLLEEYFRQYDIASEKIRELACNEEVKFTPRVIQCHAQILAWARTLPLLFGNDVITPQQLQDFEIFVWNQCQDRQHRLQAEHPLLRQFWDLYDLHNWEEVYVNGKPVMVEKLNHLTGTGKIAINMSEFGETCYKTRLDIPTLTKMFPNSSKYQFIENKVVRSRLRHMNGRTRSCWIFQEVA